ncbi:tRNA epoxyqueuosine(34) reductase QueG [Haematospirillum jordaniae]|uniref:Epoxyqueuosine reductase n=1 Tax=Haematospirillum jordaniae TaxID=1549855 RepID=A0A143DDD1_9PROT|nr:tRNA epoxyqueuosine(34) reductase QueG [Haematospirillum jordaniae]AMW34128.1 epoxyqueuosine reductase [Haematospirillum jordaniae]NKD45903.1 tRNA epoxyqueuosine(34) reductase QueG [Haematospirillum jordaniae]NKD57220.1 tRNA epoxyqueuosine(34) reductase QueG [Haematospirillum jordaniae]NKD59453.1 tRNA epoxyqueuosine(34) reductase QueG [Haematospirillum jordaniae]NKD67146.1 tRNA epoxyqueuosine(34) reductase QueG [Haematospirillum jordaniae]
MQTGTDQIKERIRKAAIKEGFDCIGFARAELNEKTRRRLSSWLAQGCHGTMGWMAETQSRRTDPRALWPEAATVISLGTNYAPGHNPLSGLMHHSRGYISVYARNRDYHDLIKGRLKQLGARIQHICDQDIKVFVDTAPLMEKPLAAAAGLGWQGKHTNIVSRRFGSWLFLGEILTTLDLPPDSPASEHCGRCTRCLDICPTSAFDAEGRIDARKCISYLTIEHKGPIPYALRSRFGNRIYGCDDCTAVCPWNRFAPPTPHDAFKPRVELTAPRLADLLELDDASFRTLFSASPVKRISRPRFIRNVLIAAGNSGDAAITKKITPHLNDPNPVIRGAAVWALSRLLDIRDFHDLAEAYGKDESDPCVREEWMLGGKPSSIQP